MGKKTHLVTKVRSLGHATEKSDFDDTGQHFNFVQQLK